MSSHPILLTTSSSGGLSASETEAVIDYLIAEGLRAATTRMENFDATIPEDILAQKALDCIVNSAVAQDTADKAPVEASDWIELGINYGPIDDDDKQVDTFISKGLNQPGTGVRLENGKEYIIGDINREAGSCSCCRLIEKTDVIAFYRPVQNGINAVVLNKDKRGPIRWNPWNKVVQDHRDGTVDREQTDIERAKRGLPVPWSPALAQTEVGTKAVF